MKDIRAIRNLVVLASIAIAAASGLAGTMLQAQETPPAWTTSNIETLKKLFPDKQAVSSFVRQFFPDAAVEPNVGEYEFVNFDNSGNVSLVITLDWSGREFYTSLIVVKKLNNKFVNQEVHTGGANITRLGDRIVDLNNDGQKEILVPRLLGPYEGTTPTPVIFDVYKWDGTQLVKANGEFKNYYANIVLPRVESALAALSQGQSTGGPTVNIKLKQKFEVEIAELKKIINQY